MALHVILHIAQTRKHRLEHRIDLAVTLSDGPLSPSGNEGIDQSIEQKGLRLEFASRTIHCHTQQRRIQNAHHREKHTHLAAFKVGLNNVLVCIHIKEVSTEELGNLITPSLIGSGGHPRIAGLLLLDIGGNLVKEIELSTIEDGLVVPLELDQFYQILIDRIQLPLHRMEVLILKSGLHVDGIGDHTGLVLGGLDGRLSHGVTQRLQTLQCTEIATGRNLAKTLLGILGAVATSIFILYLLAREGGDVAVGGNIPHIIFPIPKGLVGQIPQ